MRQARWHVKDAALTLVKVAAAIFPPLADLIGRALDSLMWDEPAETKALAEEVRAVLPARSETRKALDELDAEKSGP